MTENRNERMDILFPYDKIREGQDLLISDLVNCAKANKNMIVHAPTGIGKTAAVFSAALKQAIDGEKTIFFITSKHTQHRIAIETLKEINSKFNLKIGVTDIIGKKWMCLVPGISEMYPSEFYDYCKEQMENGTCEFYNNIKNGNRTSANANIVLNDLKERILSVDETIKLCRDNDVCPHEIAMMHAQNSNVIVADYFHILNSHIRDLLLRRIKKGLNNAVIIIDEGHNLPERCRDLLSNQISNFVLDNAIKEIRLFGDETTANNIKNIKEVLLELSKEISLVENERLVAKDEFFDAVNDLFDYKELIEHIDKLSDDILDEKKRSYAKQVASFLESWLGPDDGFARILKRGFTKGEKLNVTLTYRCLDPSIVLKHISAEANVIVMSGTLNPTSIYRDLFGFDAELKEYKDPFPQKNRLNLIVPEITTKFTARSEDMYSKIGIAAAKLVNAVPGNSIAFFPSYQLIDAIYRHFNKECEKTIFIERPKLSKIDRETIIDNFKKYKNSGAVLLACASGSFGESIDLPGDYLKAVFVVGLPLAKPDLEVKELIRYYNMKFNNGWDYGYIFPALIRCIQNAGRCIRSETDRGVIAFLDDRYRLNKYKKFFPDGWNVKITKEPITLVKEFFDEDKISKT